MTLPFTFLRRLRDGSARSGATSSDAAEALSPETVELDKALLAAIEETLTTVAPERGGALLAGADGVASLLLEDDCGVYSPVSWDISTQLTEAVGELEFTGAGVLCGTVHSHPDGVPDPSATDMRTMRHTLELNPHLHRLLILIVTRGTPREQDLALGECHRLSVHVMDRVENGFAVCRSTGVVRRLPEASGQEAERRLSATRVSEVLEERHARLMAEARAAADAQRRFEEELGGQDRTGEGDDSLARVRALVGDMGDRSVLVAGAGSVGSRIAEDLVRSGVGRIVIVDPDTVSQPNMARSVYTYAQIGTPKCHALAAQLRSVNPEVEVVPLVGTLAQRGNEGLDAGVDLVVLATDAMSEQAALASEAYLRGVPQVSCALFRQVVAGEVVIVLPASHTPCWSCCVGASVVSSTSRPAPNYGIDGRLVSESGLGASINLVASAASLAAVGILAGPQSVAGKPLIARVRDSRVYGLIATVPGWPVIEQVVQSRPYESVPRSVWPLVRRTDDCPVCGTVTEQPFSFEDEAVIDLDELIGGHSDLVRDEEATSMQRGVIIAGQDEMTAPEEVELSAESQRAGA